jgi:hypothetical protein
MYALTFKRTPRNISVVYVLYIGPTYPKILIKVYNVRDATSGYIAEKETAYSVGWWLMAGANLF